MHEEMIKNFRPGKVDSHFVSFPLFLVQIFYITKIKLVKS